MLSETVTEVDEAQKEDVEDTKTEYSYGSESEAEAKEILQQDFSLEDLPLKEINEEKYSAFPDMFK